MGSLEASVYLALVVLFLAFSFLFSGSEVALFSPWRSEPGTLVHRLRQRPYALLSAILLGNTLANSSAAATFSAFVKGAFHLPEALSWTVEVVGFTALVLVLSEISPKVLALEKPQTFARLAAPLLAAFELLFAPITWALERALGRIPASEEGFDPRRLRGLRVLFGDEADSVARLLLAQVKGFMRPREELRCLGYDATVAEVKALVAKTGRRWFLVCKESLDEILGFVDAAQLSDLPDSSPIRPFLRSPRFILESAKVWQAIKALAEEPEGVLVVIDEFGGTQGLLEPEGVVRELLGLGEAKVIRLGPRSAIVYGQVDVDAIENLTGRELGEPGEDITGFLTKHLGRLPEEGDSVEVSGVRIVVLEKRGEDVERVKVQWK